jgi:hypothetical protein
MILNSGKTYNDLGEYDECITLPGLHYGLLTVKLLPESAAQIYLGLCIPEDCSYNSLMIVAKAIDGLASDQGILTETVINFPEQEHPNAAAPGRIVGYILFGTITLCCLLGLLTEYSFFMGGSGILGVDKDELNDKNKDEELMSEKNAIGKFFLCFSFSRNIRKIWYTPTPKDNRLGVFNGVRVLSIFYVMLGHAFATCLEFPTINLLDVKDDIANSPIYPLIAGAFFAVDTFFFLSAFLGALLMLEKFYKKGSINFLFVYIH